jgi:hypothetical protein
LKGGGHEQIAAGGVFFLSIRRMAARRSRIHDWWWLRVASHYEVCFALWMSCSGKKVIGGEEFQAVAHRISQSSRGGTEERECVGENEV